MRDPAIALLLTLGLVGFFAAFIGYILLIQDLESKERYNLVIVMVVVPIFLFVWGLAWIAVSGV